MDRIVQADRDRFAISPFLGSWDRSMDYMRHTRAKGEWPWGE